MPRLPALRAVKHYKKLDTGHRQSATRVIARRKRAVRSQHQGRAVCGQRPVGEKKTFFGAFLASTKKVPAGRRTAEALDLKQPDKQKAKAGFPLPRE